MSVLGKRRKGKVEGAGNESEAMMTEVEVSVMSGSERELEKRPKVAGDLPESSAAVAMDDEEVSVKRVKRKKKRSGVRTGVEEEVGGMEISCSAGTGGLNARMREISGELVGYLRKEGVGPEVILGARSIVERFEGLLVESMLAVEHLRGQVAALERVGGRSQTSTAPAGPALSVGKVVSGSGAGGATTGGLGSAAVVSGAVGVSAATGISLPPVVPKATETWSVVVRGRKGVSSKEVVSKVVGEVAPSLGVRIHEVRQTKDGAVIRTPSVAERGKIAGNAKFTEVGLEVSVVEKLGPKVVIRGVHAEITPDEFMEDLFSLNLKEMLSREAFGRSVRLASAPWKTGDKGQVNVVLECTRGVADHLRSTGVYVKWFRFLARVQDVVPSCFRCLGYDHMIRECRQKEGVCLRCGVAGHWASRCTNEIRCRDCAFRGWPATHRMMTGDCPSYAAMVARVNSRH